MNKNSMACLLVRLLTLAGIAVLASCGSIEQERKAVPAEVQTQNTVTPEQPGQTEAPMPPVAPSAKAVPTRPLLDKTGAATGNNSAMRREDFAKRADVVHERDSRAAPSVAPMSLPAPGWTTPAEDRERYGSIKDNPVQLVAEAPVSTFSIDVDTGSYSNVRRLLNEGRLPPTDAVRVEELVNYFPYDYALPQDGRPFAVNTELATAPWGAKGEGRRLLMRIGIKGQDIAKQSLPPANLVFLVDVSGSMSSRDKLPLLKSSLKLLVNEMRPQDHITLVTYAGSTAVTLPPTAVSERARILAAIDALAAGGSTNGASGIQLAYQMAQQGFIRGGINRILLATDGDFNVGTTDFAQLKGMVEERRRSGVSLSTLGFGTGNYNEQLMEQLADAGDGAYSYIDTLMEGHKVLVNEMTSSLATIARDVKIQVEFNPATVQEYRLVGYENRMLAREDFNNDKVDGGDIGAGHSMTALYELTLKGEAGLIDPLRYGVAPNGNTGVVGPRGLAGELAHVKLRYKLPESQSSTLMDTVVRRESVRSIEQASNEFRFATAVAGFGQLLRGGKYAGQWGYADARALASSGVGQDRFGYRGEFLRLVDMAASLSTRAVAVAQ